MKLVTAVRLFPDTAQAAALEDTLTVCNRAADHASRIAYDRDVRSKQALQRAVYGDLKDMGLSAQPAIHVARKVAGAYATFQTHPSSPPPASLASTWGSRTSPAPRTALGTAARA